MAHSHIISAFDEELKYLQRRISEMGGMAEEMVSQSVVALVNTDTELAEKVIAEDLALDEAERQGVEVMAFGDLFLEDRLVEIGIELPALGFNHRHIMVNEQLDDHLVGQPHALEHPPGSVFLLIGALDRPLKIVDHGQEAFDEPANRYVPVLCRLPGFLFLEVLEISLGSQQLLDEGVCLLLDLKERAMLLFARRSPGNFLPSASGGELDVFFRS